MCPSALSSSFLRLMSDTAPFVWHPSDGALSIVALGDSSNMNHVITAMTPRLVIQESVVLAVYMLEIVRDLQVPNPTIQCLLSPPRALCSDHGFASH